MTQLMQEGFEEHDWDEKWTRRVGMEKRTTERPHTGSYSMWFESGGAIGKTFDSQLTDAYISYYFYDEGRTVIVPDENDIIVSSGEINDKTKTFRLGIATQNSNDYYSYWRTGGTNWVTTTVRRAIGWHKVEIWVYNGGLTASIDNQIIVRNYTSVNILNSFLFMCSPGPLEWWVDDISVYSPSLYYPGENGNGPPPPPEESPATIPLTVGVLVLLALASL